MVDVEEGDAAAVETVRLHAVRGERKQKWGDIGFTWTHVQSSIVCVGNVMQKIDKVGDTTAASLFLWETACCERGEGAEMGRHRIDAD